MKKSIPIIFLLVFLAGCTTFDNKKVKFTHRGPEGQLLGTWELDTPAEAHAELTTGEYKMVYDGKTSNILKDLLLMKAADTDISVSNKEGK